MDLGNQKQFKIASGKAITSRVSDHAPLPKTDDAAEILQFALESAGAGIWEQNLVTEIVQLCPQCRRLLGLPDDHSGVLTQEEWRKLADVQDLDQIQRWARTPTASIAPHTQEFRSLRPDGEVRWIRVTARMLTDQEGRFTRLVGLMFDETNRKCAEDSLRESEERLRLVQDAALIGTFVTDPDGKVAGSRQFYRNLGLPENTEFLDGDTYIGLVHPDDREWVKSEASANLSDDAKDIEYRFNRADTGELRWIFMRRKYERTDDGQLIRTVGAHLDITEHKRTEETMRESEERLYLVQDAALIGTFVTDADYRTMGSRQFYRNLGMPEDTGFMSRVERMATVHPDDLERLQRESKIATQSANGLDIEFRIRCADTGEIRWIFSRNKFERADDGQLLRFVGAELDITERKRAEAALHESMAFSQSMIDASADCVKLVDLDGRLLFMNKQGLAAFEIEDATGLWERNWAGLWPPAERHKVEVAVQAAREGRTGRFNGGCPTVTGKPKWWDVVVTPICDEQGQPRQLLAVSRDITEHRDQMAQIRWTASHDMLTELPNRRYFQDRLEKVLVRAGEQGSHVGLLQLDVDDFKQTNDALGHDAGDALLKSFSQRLQKATQGNEIVARLGGDEFAIIVPDLEAGRSLSSVVDTIRAQFTEPFVYQGRVFDCRASIGEAIYPQHGETVDNLLKSSDIALYAAKSSGRGNVRRFDPSMRSDMQRRLDMIDRARTALKDDLIFPYYQPKIDFRTGGLAGFEALLRWQNPKGRIQPPAAIAAAFVDLDVAQALSERMQLRVLADMRCWLDDGVDFGHVAINASAAEFRQNDFAERLLNRVKAAGVPTRNIELEVTETVFLGRGAEYVDRALHLLSAEGIRIALDDFGTGYASLSHLKKFPVDIIKIDQSFVRNMYDNPDDCAIIKALISLSKELLISIVAEGVESHAQALFLEEHGCDFGQGYLFGKAVSAAKVPELISRLKKDVCAIRADSHQSGSYPQEAK